MSPAPQTPNIGQLHQRTILLTGGLGGLGVSLTRALLQAGADVVCTDLQLEPITEIWDQLMSIAELSNRRLTYIPCDVTQEQSVHDAFEKADTDSHFPLKGLITCAGISGNIEAINYPIAAFRKIHEVNVIGTFLAAQAAARIFRRRQVAGSIVMLASMSASNANRGVNTSAYNSSKAAVVQLARNLAAEWGVHNEGPPIRVNTLSPGYIITPITGPTLEAHPHLKTVWPEGNMLGQLSDTEEYHTAVLFLLGDGSSFMTASDLRIDGGHCAW